MAKTNDFTYEVKAEIGELSDKKKVRVVAWGEREAKIDIREWYEKDGETKAGKGVSLTNEEARKLVELLGEYLNDEDDDI